MIFRPCPIFINKTVTISHIIVLFSTLVSSPIVLYWSCHIFVLYNVHYIFQFSFQYVFVFFKKLLFYNFHGGIWYFTYSVRYNTQYLVQYKKKAKKKDVQKEFFFNFVIEINFTYVLYCSWENCTYCLLYRMCFHPNQKQIVTADWISRFCSCVVCGLQQRFWVFSNYCYHHETKIYCNSNWYNCVVFNLFKWTPVY